MSFGYFGLWWLLSMVPMVAVASVPEANLARVITLRAEKVAISQPLTYPALVEAKVQATVLAEADGVVKQIHSLLGQKTGRGHRLMTIQQTDPIFQFAPVAIKSPVAGIVSELNVTEGALVTKGQKLASVIDPKQLRILVEIPAQDLRFIGVGLKGEFVSPALSRPVPMGLVGVSPNVDPGTGTASAQLSPSGKTGTSLIPGMIGKVLFQVNLHQGILVPEDAVVQFRQQTYLRTIKSGRVQQVPVVLGERSRGQVEILSGLEDGEKVVTRSSRYLSEGDEVVEDNPQEKVETETKESASPEGARSKSP